MKNLKEVLPILAIFYILNECYSLYLNFTMENSYVKSMLGNLADFNFRYLDVHFFRTILGWMIFVVLIIGVVKFYNSAEKKINKYLEFALIYQAFSTFFHLPTSLKFLFGSSPAYSTSPSTLNYVLSILFMMACGIILVYFSRQIKTFQRPAFGEREKSYGQTPFEQYLESGNISVSRWLRFVNYLLDGFFIYVLAFSAMMQFMRVFFGFRHYDLGGAMAFRLMMILSLLVYYFLMEAIIGKTLGKIITGSHVQFYGKSSFNGALGRTVCRLIPLEPLSYFFKKGYGWHDQFSGTTVEKTTHTEHQDLSDLTEHLLENE